MVPPAGIDVGTAKRRSWARFDPELADRQLSDG